MLFLRKCIKVYQGILTCYKLEVKMYIIKYQLNGFSHPINLQSTCIKHKLMTIQYILIEYFNTLILCFMFIK